MDQQGFQQIQNQVPYKEIDSITIESVEQVDNKYKIICKRKIKDQSNGSDPLIRSQQDINWLLSNLQNSGKLCLIPHVNIKSYITLLKQKINMQETMKGKYFKMLEKKIVERCLNIVCKVILDYLKIQNKNAIIPIFIFFHNNFSLYKTPNYYKTETKTITKAVGDYLWGKIALFKGTNVGFDSVEAQNQLIKQKMIKLKSISTKLTDYVYYLDKLQNEFFPEKDKIRKRLIPIEQVLYQFENQVTYLNLITDEIDQTMIKITNKGQVQNLMKAYSEFLKKQNLACQKNFSQLISESVRVICGYQIKITVPAH